MLRQALAVLALLALATFRTTAPASAALFPASGHVYLSFHPVVQQDTREVLPGEEFELYISVDIPLDPQNPLDGIVGVEGGVALPAELEFVGIVFDDPAINLGWSFREPGLETFIVGLGECRALGPRETIGTMTLRLAGPASDLEIAVTAPAIGAAALSSFAGIGPGWARETCGGEDPNELVLFETPAGPGSRLVLNPLVDNGASAFSLLKVTFGN